MGCRAPQMRQPERGVGRLAGDRRRRGRPDVRTPATPFVARPRPLSAMRTDVRPTGRADIRCPGDQCPHDLCDPAVRTDRRPVSAAAAAALSAPRWIVEGVGAAGPATVGAPGWTCRCGPRAAWSSLPESGLAGKGWSNVGSARLARGSTPDLSRRFACVQAAAPCSPPGRPRELVQRRGAGRLPGSREGAGAPKSPAGASWAGCRLMPDMGLDREG